MMRRVISEQWTAACEEYLLSMRKRAHDPQLRDPIRRPPLNPAPLPDIPKQMPTIPEGADLPQEWVEYQKTLNERAQIAHDIELVLSRAWEEYWADIAERVDLLFARPRHQRRARAPTANLVLIEARINAALRLGLAGRFPMFSLSWPQDGVDFRHAEGRHKDLFSLVDAELAAQKTGANISAACAIVHERLSKPGCSDGHLLGYGEQGKVMTRESLRQQYARRNAWTPQRQAQAVNRGAVLAIRSDLFKVAKRHLPRQVQPDPTPVVIFDGLGPPDF